MVLELNPKGRLLELHPEAAFTPGGELRFSPYLDGHNHAERSVHISRRCVKENISSAYAATKVLTDMGILCQVEPAHSLALDERKQVAQAAVERLTRRTTQTGGELAWTPNSSTPSI